MIHTVIDIEHNILTESASVVPYQYEDIPYCFEAVFNEHLSAIISVTAFYFSRFSDEAFGPHGAVHAFRLSNMGQSCILRVRDSYYEDIQSSSITTVKEFLPLIGVNESEKWLNEIEKLDALSKNNYKKDPIWMNVIQSLPNLNDGEEVKVLGYDNPLLIKMFDYPSFSGTFRCFYASSTADAESQRLDERSENGMIILNDKFESMSERDNEDMYKDIQEKYNRMMSLFL